MAITFTIKKQIANKDTVADALNALQVDLVGVMTQLTASIGNQLVFIQDVTLTDTAATAVAHFLQRTLRGFIVVDKTASFDVYRDASASNPDPLRYVMLRTSSGTQTVSLLVF